MKGGDKGAEDEDANGTRNEVPCNTTLTWAIAFRADALGHLVLLLLLLLLVLVLERGKNAKSFVRASFLVVLSFLTTTPPESVKAFETQVTCRCVA